MSNAELPPYGAPVPTPPPPGFGPPVRSNSAATWSLVLGIVSLFLNVCFLPTGGAIWLGIVGLKKANALGGEGKVKSIWGIVLGAVGAVAAIFMTMILFAGLFSADTSDTKKPTVVASSQPAGEVDLSQSTCKQVAQDAVRVSAQNNKGSGFTTLEKVRDPQVVVDNRNTFKFPKDTSEAVVLTCEGQGVWSDLSNDRVRVTETVDSDREIWIKYEPLP